ncbi:MAG: glycerol-3-phosphate 1-O-acyltransferase PlsY [Polynucleobacter sp.]
MVVSRAMGLPDPYTHGSKNPGATNVLRTGNKVAAALTLIGDAAKGWLAVTLARAVLGDPSQESVNILLGLVAIAVFIGHLYPIFHRFRGGKGVATAAGILFAINWALGLATLGTWLIVAVFMRYSSLAALCAAVFAPIYFTFLFGAQPMGLAITMMSALLIYRHRSNIRNLLNGTETRLSKK